MPWTSPISGCWKKLLERYPDPELEAFVASFEPRWQEGRGPIVYPDAPRRWLPKDPGQGLERFRNYVGAVSGRPATRAARFLDEFTRIPGEGYVLTHQYVALEKAEETGSRSPRKCASAGPRCCASCARSTTPIRDRAISISSAPCFCCSTRTRTKPRRAAGSSGCSASGMRRTSDGPTTTSRSCASNGHVRRFRYSPEHPTVMALGAVREYLGPSRPAEAPGVSR